MFQATHLIGFGAKRAAGGGGPSSIGRPWNSADKAAALSLSNNDYDATGSSGWASVRATGGMAGTEKVYWEVKITNAVGGVMVGMANGSFTLTNYLGTSSGSCGFQSAAAAYFSGVTRDYATAMPTCSTNDIWMLAFDRGAGKLWLGRNGTWLNSGNPAGGTGSVMSAMTSGTWYPACSADAATNTMRMISAEVNLTYAIPSGFTSYGDL